MNSPRNKRAIYVVRTLHGIFAVFFIFLIGYLYYALIAGRTDWTVWAAVILLIAEGAAMALNGGRCPLAFLHERYGDDKGFFDLWVPPKLLPLVVPFLTALTTIAVLWLLAKTLL